jgi:predicted alpha/beta-fold hydrolase
MQFLKHITVPTLVLHALDDPFMNQSVVPTTQALSDKVAYEFSPRGGHVGFAQGMPWATTTWLGRRIVAFIDEQLKR